MGAGGGGILGEHVDPSSFEDHCRAETDTGLSSPRLEVDQPVLILLHLLEAGLRQHVLLNVLHVHSLQC